ncbi:methylated-DNA--[protein]-cysteine S-methyltransferase [Staphylococcus xylosus]|uniref:methylated-DNA--[protein]-cysteine S-methyltransferase n=1 Tax=Staphylococcus xylosus TaxID=1288 RepID=UPI0008533D56|nr:methylated-DNA--[protein]-cysteine S-methyltransferase [Staphylococcus xylosus]MCE7782584.1 methylated-DNA--[protein]-cysteine S-methyltransferase [Staphylococcus xylosus]MEB6290703.1 methylated-DNA--[protein]-cysteine S-methyltransferase [Staphylococcus xylosus]MEB7660462.1 methylated-DNA--[protein]-cysteine S-methyltransferase [Staphylococcus xylosus]MEB7710349.1 methylated-DNA--[protein]-cysteine S-methyltransferase [Staphylococcus xylosus]MEB7719268.1 methylated-DNA--[protein]-cysteine 
MYYKTTYQSPIGQITLTSDGESITGLWLPNHQDIESHYDDKLIEKDQPVFEQATRWLDSYFSGNKPKIDFPLKAIGTPFRETVWKILLEIPHGETVTYSDIAQKVALERGKEKMSSQAVGGAVGSNPISIIIPCHRVVGKDGSLTGYGGGIDTKIELLKLEQQDMTQFYKPKNSTKP